jgi:Ca-activated chloride channel family protein
MGAGSVAYLSLNDKADDVMSAYFQRISHPALTDIDVDFGKMQVSDVFASKVPDLFVGRPVILTGRFKVDGTTTVRVKGKVGGEAREFSIPVNVDDKSAQHQGIASVWSRAKITEIADKSAWDTTENWAAAVKNIAIDYGLMSQFTAFVAVDSSTQTAGTKGTTVAVPVPVPDGVKYQRTGGEK